MSAVKQVGGEKQTKQVSETAKRAAMRPQGGYVDLNLTREGGRRMVLRRDRVEIGNSGLYYNDHLKRIVVSGEHKDNGLVHLAPSANVCRLGRT